MRLNKILWCAFFGALLVSVALAFAQTTVPASAAVSWVAPVNDLNGVPLAGSPNAVTSYNVYLSATPLTATPTGTPTAVVTAPSTTVMSSMQIANGATLYAYVTACNANGCSVLSTPGSKVVSIPAVVPGVPTTVTVTVTIT